MTSRRQARELALQILFQTEFINNPDVDHSLDLYRTSFEQDLLSYTNGLVHGIYDHLQEIDAKIAAYSQNWKLSRMALVDRNVLRIAAYELLYCHDQIPPKVAINEAVEIAKNYGSNDSSAFVNAILDQIAHSSGSSPEISH